MGILREDVSALKRGLDILLGSDNANGICMVVNINGNVSVVSIDLPNIPFDSDEAIGEVGYKLGQAVSTLSLKITENFNEIVKGE